MSKFSLFFLLSVGVCSANLNFLTIGDWGGSPVPPYTMPGQKQSVVGMDKIATAMKSQFVVALGDNFYFTGVDNENDKRFDRTFGDVYTPESLQTPWYVIAGNHDYKGNVTAQIAHSKKSARWVFPSEYHARSFTADDGATLDLILIDTPMLSSSNPAATEAEEGYFAPLPLLPKSYAEDQWSWIESQLKASTADYILVGGHYPVWSVCEHGPSSTLVAHLKPLLEAYGAHYMSGHDHCMEHLVENNGKEVNYFLSGMGDTCCYKPSQKEAVPEGALKWYIALDNMNKARAGFTSFSLNKEAMTAVYYDQDGTVLYTTPAILPRKKA
jgi:3',5'-cyclic AMP phosphodiesterase CpdA